MRGRYTGAIKKAFVYAYHRERFLAYFLLFLLGIVAFVPFFVLTGTNEAVILGALGIIAGLVLLLGFMGIEGTIIRNAYDYFGGKDVGLRASWDEFKKKYHVFIGVYLAIGILTLSLPLFGEFGAFIAFVVMLAFFFAYQQAAIFGKDFADVMVDSYNHFIKQWKHVFWMWLTYNLLLVILFVVAVSLLYLIAPHAAVVALVRGNMAIAMPFIGRIVLGTIVMAIAFAYFRVVVVAFKTELYRNIE
ncbi:hypothetical protein ACFLQI_02645 [Candidatus Undinarchaeota archaeon]